MAYEQILYAVDGTVATITLNRPEKLNAWGPLIEREVRAALTCAVGDPAVRSIVITGAGRGFCSGADKDRLAQRSAGTPVEVNPDPDEPWLAKAPPALRTRFSYIAASPKPTIAAVNGPCAGVGLVLACYCDVRIAGESAAFLTAFSRVGLIAEHGIAWLLPRIVGHGNAMDLLLSSRKIGAAEAKSIGLVSRVVPDAELAATASGYARDLGEKVSPRSVRVLKRQVWQGQFSGLADALALAKAEQAQSLASDEFRDGVMRVVGPGKV
ncbi:MAG: enoyl-CoA hydratase-related protein [Burkholderiales bacterium]